MPKNSSRSKSIDQFIYDLKSGKVGTSLHSETKLSKKDLIRHNGPAIHSYPEKKKLEKLIPYEKLATPIAKPNKVKLGIDIDENRFPADAKVKNVKKYDDNGNYIKYKPKMKKDNSAGISTAGLVRSSLRSNIDTRGRKKTTVA